MPISSPNDLSPDSYFAPGDYFAPTWVRTTGVADLIATGDEPTETDGCPTWAAGTDSLQAANQFTGWTSVGGKHFFAWVDLATITGSAAGASYTWPGLIRDTDQYVGLHIGRTGAGPYQYWARIYNWDGGDKSATVEITSLVDASGAGELVIQGKHTGGNLYIRANGGAWSSATASGNTTNTSGFQQVGSPAGFEGVIKSIATWSAALSDGDADDLVEWAMGAPAAESVAFTRPRHPVRGPVRSFRPRVKAWDSAQAPTAVPASVTFAGTSSVAATGILGKAWQMLVAGAGALSAAAKVGLAWTLAFVATSSASVTALLGRAGLWTVPTAGTMAASSTVITGIPASCTFTCTSTMAATGVVIEAIPASATFAGTSTMAVTGTVEEYVAPDDSPPASRIKLSAWGMGL